MGNQIVQAFVVMFLTDGVSTTLEVDFKTAPIQLQSGSPLTSFEPDKASTIVNLVVNDPAVTVTLASWRGGVAVFLFSVPLSVVGLHNLDGQLVFS